MVVCVGFGLRSAGGLYLHALVCRLGFRFLAVRRGLRILILNLGFGFVDFSALWFALIGLIVWGEWFGMDWLG